MNNKVKQLLEEIAEKAQKSAISIPTIIAASKTRTKPEIIAAKTAGIAHFGENYVQEAQKKQDVFTGCTLHLIGHLQSNKAAIAAELFDVIHTIDRVKLAKTLNKACENLNKVMNVFIQVNIGKEDSKTGVLPEGITQLAEYIKSCNNLKLMGLMAIPPKNEPATPYFNQLRELAESNELNQLSMGMSGDWAEAVACGATHIRVGTGIFGVRTINEEGVAN